MQALIAGPTVFICNECVGLCGNIVQDQAIDQALRETPDDDRFAATVEIMRRKDDAELAAYRAAAESWRDHVQGSLSQSADGSSRALQGKSPQEIEAQRDSLRASLGRVEDRLRAAEMILEERTRP